MCLRDPLYFARQRRAKEGRKSCLLLHHAITFPGPYIASNAALVLHFAFRVEEDKNVFCKKNDSSSSSSGKYMSTACVSFVCQLKEAEERRRRRRRRKKKKKKKEEE